MAAHSCKRSWMCLGHVFLGLMWGLQAARGLGYSAVGGTRGSASRRGRHRWLGRPSGEGPSVSGPLHLPNMPWMCFPPLCICCGVQWEVDTGVLVGGRGDYVWPWFRSVCHLPPWGLHWLFCLRIRRHYIFTAQYAYAIRTTWVTNWHKVCLFGSDNYFKSHLFRVGC